MSIDSLLNSNLFNNSFGNGFKNLFTNFPVPTFPMFNFYSINFNNSANYSFSQTNIWDVAKFQCSQPAQPVQLPKTTQSNYSTITGLNQKSKYSSLNSTIANYDASAGKKLANTALEASKGFKGRCAASVKTAIKDAQLGSYESGHAHQVDDILRRNKNFKEISVQDVNLKELPAGCVLVYEKGVAGYSKQYGHTEITTGDGRAVSDGITNNLYKKPSSIFVPVTT